MVVREINNIRFAVEPAYPNKILLNDETYNLMNQPDCVMLDDLSDFIESHSESALPLSLHWHMTTRCNFSCPFCYIRDNSHVESYSYDEVAPVIDSMVENGLLKATLSGGECLLVKDFTKIYRHFKENGVFVSIYTNGSLINKELLDLFKELPPFSVEITFYDCDFSSAPFVNAELLISNGINVIGKFTITNQNIDMFEKIDSWCKSRNIEIKIETDLFNGSNTEDISNFLVSEEQLQIFDAKRFSEYFHNTNKLNKPKIGFYCHAAKTCIHLSPELELSLCYKMNNSWSLKKLCFKDAYEALQVYIDSLKNECLVGCKGCEAAFMCKMCLAVAEQHSTVNGVSFHVPEGYCNTIKSRYNAALKK